MKWILGLVALLALVVALPMEGLLEHALTVGSFAGMALAVTFPKGDEALHYISEDWDGTLGAASPATGIFAATWVAVDGLGEYNRSNSANTTDHRIFGRAQAVSTVGVPGRTVSLNGWYADGDPAQDVLRAYAPGGANAGEDLGYAYLRDGTKGYAMMVQVGGGEERSNAEGGLQPVSFTLAPQSDAVTVTTGIP